MSTLSPRSAPSEGNLKKSKLIVENSRYGDRPTLASSTRSGAAPALTRRGDSRSEAGGLGLTTLAGEIRGDRRKILGASVVFDLEDPGDLASLADPMLTRSGRCVRAGRDSTKCSDYPDCCSGSVCSWTGHEHRRDFWFSAAPPQSCWAATRPTHWPAGWHFTSLAASRLTKWALEIVPRFGCAAASPDPSSPGQAGRAWTGGSTSSKLSRARRATTRGVDSGSDTPPLLDDACP